MPTGDANSLLSADVDGLHKISYAALKSADPATW
jgi:hypothetical protein